MEFLRGRARQGTGRWDRCVIKRTADQAVAHGGDISSLKDLTKVLTDQHLKIKMFEIDIEEIEAMDKCLLTNLKAPKNTMKLHQVTWKSNDAQSLELRELSCIDCGYDRCEHFAMTPALWIVPELVDVHEHTNTSSHHKGRIIVKQPTDRPQSYV